MDQFISSFPEDCSYFGIVLPPENIIERCADVAARNNLNSEQFFEQWISFSMFNSANKDGTTPNDHNLELFERHLLEQNEKQSKKKTKDTVKTKQTSTGDPINASYSYSPSEKKRKGDDIVDDLQNAKRPREDQTKKKDDKEIDMNLSNCLSSSVQIAEDEDNELAAMYENFSERKEPLKVRDSYGTDKELISKATFKNSGVETTLDIKQIFAKEKLKPDTKLLFDVKLVKRQIINAKIDNIAKYLIKKHQLEDAEPYISIPYRPDSVIVYGQVCNSNKGKMDKTSVRLESSLDIGMGTTSNLDLNPIETNASLFPGQVVAISAHKGRKGHIGAAKIYTDATLDLPKELPRFNSADPLQIVVACGPFTMSNNLSYEPLIALMAYVHEHRPHALILMGPFLSAHEKHQTLDQTYESHFEVLINGLMQNLTEDKCNTQVVIVSSSNDLHHFNVYPTPPYELERKYTNLHFMPDPSIISINGVQIGATSTDILFHLNKEELFVSKTGQFMKNRMSRIVESIISQQSFYPLYPPNKEVCMDMKLFMKHGYMKETPHIMILPSCLRYFVRDIQGCVVVNPEKLVKGYTAGTFARLEVHPNQTSNSLSDNIICEILNI